MSFDTSAPVPVSLSEKAAALYLQTPKKYNCAQAVAAAVDRHDLLDSLASCGGGKAPGGLCGALFAVISLTDAAEHEKIQEQFRQKIGHCQCKKIRQGKLALCADCIRCAAAEMRQATTGKRAAERVSPKRRV